ncbi:MAG TPA: sugar ABC transporter permease [Anaerolineales bacterium]|nr:sugar ABC transporter permease [Anaerolineales bacterium]
MTAIDEVKNPETLWERFTANIVRILISIAIPTITFIILRAIFIFLRDTDAPTWLTAIVAIIWGVGGVALLYVIANYIVDQFSDKWKARLIPFIFIGPAVAILFYFLALPTLRSFYLSLLDRTGSFVWFKNYAFVFTNKTMLEAFKNNLYWLIFGTGMSVGFGLIIAVLADRVHPALENLVKSIVFMPYAISMIGASVIWRFVYDFRPVGAEQIGLLNAIIVGLGGEPQAWLIQGPWNTFFLIIILVWLQTGYSMVILSAAIKGMPRELMEAARIDGATEVQVFFRITIPYIAGTLVTVTTTVVIFTLKIFDIVKGMTGGNFGTEVIANQQVTQMFDFGDFGRGSAIAIVLLILVIPVMYYNLRNFSEQTEAF